MNIRRMAACLAAGLMTAAAAQAQMSQYDYNQPVGWGTVDGEITGSDDENPVLVTTLDEFKSAFTGTTKKTIYIEGEIEFTGVVSKSNVKNKTVYGLPGSALVNSTHTSTVSKTGILSMSSCSNVIFRNVTFKSAGAYDIDGYDNLNFTGCTYIWVDHCDFQDGVDGNLDCNNASNNICVSWTRFRYLIDPWSGGSGGSDDHRFTNLWGGSDKNASKDEDKLCTTFYSCWWDEGCKERMPRIRFGKVHIVNCYYGCSTANYCVGTGYRCNAYVENCSFTSGIKYNYKNYATSSGYTDYNITLVGCENQADNQAQSGSIDYFYPSDYYTLEAYPVGEVVTEVSTYAGATLDVSYGSGVNTSIGSTTATGATVVSVAYYTLNGQKIAQPQQGINIVVRTLSDGTTQTVKTFAR